MYIHILSNTHSLQCATQQNYCCMYIVVEWYFHHYQIHMNNYGSYIWNWFHWLLSSGGTRQTNSRLSINWLTVENKWQLSTILTNSNWDWEITITNVSLLNVSMYLFALTNLTTNFIFRLHLPPFWSHVHNNRVREWHEHLFQQ